MQQIQQLSTDLWPPQREKLDQKERRVCLMRVPLQLNDGQGKRTVQKEVQSKMLAEHSSTQHKYFSTLKNVSNALSSWR
jgi:hypothetical protein